MQRQGVPSFASVGYVCKEVCLEVGVGPRFERVTIPRTNDVHEWLSIVMVYIFWTFSLIGGVKNQKCPEIRDRNGGPGRTVDCTCRHQGRYGASSSLKTEDY